MQLLLIEDDQNLGEPIVQALEEDGHAVKWVCAGDEGLYHAVEWEYDLVILDRMLPGRDGMELMAELRKRKSTPILMLTALNTVSHRIEGLDAGADDYLGKPFELPELLSRVRALARRGSARCGPVIEIGDLQIDFASHRIRKGGSEVHLTPAEFETVELLARRRGQTVHRRILEDILHREEEDPSANALEVHIHRIRKKLGPGLILTRRGLGYEIPTES